MKQALFPIAWTVAGSDSGAGAGLQADLRAFDAFGVHGCCAVAAITAQNSVAVQAVEAVSHRMLDAQLAALAADLPPAAIKAGMLGSAGNLHALVRWIDRLRESRPGLPLVVDPVLGSTTGTSFANEELLQAYRRTLLPRTSLLTPNRREAAALLGQAPLQSRADVEQAAKALLEMGCQAVVITGGDDGGDSSEDYAATPHASGWLTLARVATPHHHGTGCVFASSAAAALALGFVEIEAIILAKMATAQALRHGYAAGLGAGPVRPRAGFGLDAENLPHFSIPGRARGDGFAALADADLGLYAVVDSATWVRRVLDGGVRTVQLRIKSAEHPTLRDELRASIAAARAVNAQLFINDHWQLAIEEGAYGVHLGQEDLETADLAAIAQAGLRLGISTHAYWEVCRALRLQPSYIACGPIHPTQAKAMPWLPQGNDNLAYWCRLLPLPVVAIAGMDMERALQAAQCGAAGVAVISAITAAAAPEAAIMDLQNAIRTGQRLAQRQPAALPRPTLLR
ncbi:MAG TPA: bifunctional hydroxymethylpyrimidine kinase/phosphomethylpyrimidine kinase [Burkholderiaceae bacterium]|nr:bifunctional hydroxymethylpyrimidine kinase/phosphomethylpyrimidine kinase [Burkholderiaceae bacterium]